MRNIFGADTHWTPLKLWLGAKHLVRPPRQLDKIKSGAIRVGRLNLNNLGSLGFALPHVTDRFSRPKAEKDCFQVDPETVNESNRCCQISCRFLLIDNCCTCTTLNTPKEEINPHAQMILCALKYSQPLCSCCSCTPQYTSRNDIYAKCIGWSLLILLSYDTLKTWLHKGQRALLCETNHSFMQVRWKWWPQGTLTSWAVRRWHRKTIPSTIN